MKYFSALIVIASSSVVLAQTGTVTPAPHLPTADDRVLSLAWTDATRSLQIPVSNSGDKALQVLGAQSTSGIFVVDFPKTIPAKGSALISVIYEAKAGSDSEVELVRLKTDAGEKLVRVTIAREPVVTFETKQLKWAVGEARQAKTVLVVVDKGVTIKSVSAGKGHFAEVQKVNATSYRIVVTPQSTAKATTFPVAVTLNPSVPGLTPFITCSVANAD